MPTIRIDDIKEWPPERFDKALREAMKDSSPLDALSETQAELLEYEHKYDMTTEEFYARFMRGEMSDTKEFIGWAGVYEAFLHLKRGLEVTLMQATVQRDVLVQRVVEAVAV